MALSRPASLCPEHDLFDFNCGELLLDDWLKQRARKNESRFSRTYVVADGWRVVAYVSISAGSVDRSAAPGKLRRNAPEIVPVSIIGRLAVDTAFARKGLGSDLLADALRRIASASKAIGIAAVLVHAKSDAARRFYLSRAEFVEFPPDSRILFLPIEALAPSLD